LKSQGKTDGEHSLAVLYSRSDGSWTAILSSNKYGGL